jgi:pSer/pThr/pTyr-binding forkhead associated (FHA) protein
MFRNKNVIIATLIAMPSTPKPTARLIWTTEEGRKEKLVKAGDVVTIGRGDNNTIVINSPKISRNHARIEWIGEQVTVRDLGSSNGTFVNGQRVESMPFTLKDGDELRFERLLFKFEGTAIARKVQDVFGMETVPAENSSHTSAKAHLEVISGFDKGLIYTILNDTVTIGRASMQASWELCLNDGAVSRPHATIEKRGSSYYLIDLGSANGTTVNDLFVIEPVLLTDGDEIGLGGSRLIIHIPKMKT